MLKIRELKTKDIYPLTIILSRLDLGGLGKLLAPGATEIPVFALIDLVVKRIPELQDVLFPFLADLVGMTVEGFAEQPLEVLIDVVKQLAQRPEVAGFFGSTKQATP